VTSRCGRDRPLVITPGGARAALARVLSAERAGGSRAWGTRDPGVEVKGSHGCCWGKKRKGAGVSGGEAEKIKIATWFHELLFLVNKGGGAMPKSSENCRNFVKLFE